MMNPLWQQLASKADLTLTEPQGNQLAQYLDLLSEANKVMNLTRIVDREQAEVQHIGDALTVLPFLPKSPCSFADLGSGGGVPGIPLAIVRSDCQVTLIDATRKKADFLDRTAKTLGLNNVKVVWIRAEEAGMGKLRQSQDVVVARAVGEMAFLIEWAIPLLKVGGKLLAMKGQKAQEELALCGKVCQELKTAAPILHPVQLPGTDHRVVVEILKKGPTDARYPRPATVAKGKSL